MSDANKAGDSRSTPAIPFTRHRSSRLAVEPKRIDAALDSASEVFRELKGSTDQEKAPSVIGVEKDEIKVQVGERGRVKNKSGKVPEEDRWRRVEKNTRLTHTMGVRMTVAERRAFEDAAKERGYTSASSFVRQVALEALKKGKG